MKRFLSFFAIFCASLTLASSLPPSVDEEFYTDAPAPSGGGGSDDLTGISLRYVGDDVTGSDGASVSSWPDSGGGSFNAIQDNGSWLPVVKVNVVNGHRAVQFDGVDDILKTNISPTSVSTATATAIFIVLKQTGTQARNISVSWYDAGLADFMEVLSTYDDTIYFDHESVANGRVSGSQPVGWDDAWHVLELHRNGATMSILVDGSSVAATSGASGNFVQTGLGLFNIGGDIGNLFFKGQIAEIRVYNGNKDSTSSATIRGALKTTYGTP
jgi:hypothetical protein